MGGASQAVGMNPKVLRRARAISVMRLRRFGTIKEIFTPEGLELGAAQLRERLEDRKEDRLWERSFFRSDVLKRVPFETHGQVAKMIVALKTLFIVRRSSHGDASEIKAARERALEATRRVEIAAQVLRRYVESKSWGGGVNADYLLKVAAEIEDWSYYGASTDSFAEVLLDPSLAGQKGEFKAYAIKSIDRLLPPTTQNRDAVIRDFLNLIGVEVTNQLVRSTRLRGQT